MSTTVRKRLPQIVAVSSLIAHALFVSGVAAAEAQSSDCLTSTEGPSVSASPSEEETSRSTRVVMPSVGEGGDEATVHWNHAVGDDVTKGEPLLEVSTDKVMMEIESPATGVLIEICIDDGRTADTGETLAVIGPPGSTPPTAE
ncbi:biotin/lipoyl-containing protein [Streptomyces erythrochromogenes]|uniref:biotin/lipoyl-containing protein n=1 Tax=Streptomyces erythrochromogenes TaxID=285574 RepID=UPI0036B03F6E